MSALTSAPERAEVPRKRTQCSRRWTRPLVPSVSSLEPDIEAGDDVDERNVAFLVEEDLQAVVENEIPARLGGAEGSGGEPEAGEQEAGPDP